MNRTMENSQKLRFDSLWGKYSKAVSAGDSYVDNQFSGGDILTLVARLDHNIQTSLSIATTKIAADSRAFYTYPPRTIHTTILFLTPYVGPEINLEKQHRVLDAVSRAVSKSPAINYQVRGLGIFPTTIFSQLYIDQSNQLGDLRHAIADSLKMAGLISPATAIYEDNLDWQLSFANVARCLQPMGHDTVERVSPLRHLSFGQGTLRHLELVTTDKFLSVDNTRTLATLTLGE